MKSEKHDRLLRELSEFAGLVESYHDVEGTEHSLTRDDRIALLRAFSIEAGSIATAIHSLRSVRRKSVSRVLPTVVVRSTDQLPFSIAVCLPDYLFDVPLQGEVTLEGGPTIPFRIDLLKSGSMKVDGLLYHFCHFELNQLFPPGYHTMRAYDAEGRINSRCQFIMCPDRCFQLPRDERYSGVWLQLYALRSPGSGGFGDLTTLLEAARSLRLGDNGSFTGGDPQMAYHARADRKHRVLAINPLHALAPRADRISPYYPSSRLLIHPMYIRASDTPEWELLSDEKRDLLEQEMRRMDQSSANHLVMDHPSIQQLRWRVLRAIYTSTSMRAWPRQAEFERFATMEDVRRVSLHDALFAYFATRGHVGWKNWPVAFQDPDDPSVAEFAETHRDEIRFHAFAYFLADRQWSRVTEELSRQGILLNTDLAVGVASDSADSWANNSLFAKRATVGAPPDAFSPLGQDWGLAAFNPLELNERAYTPFIALIRANMVTDGLLRIDHFMQLQRLFWHVPGGSGYVGYPFHDLVRILALESQRHRCVVIGEDLGTIPEDLRQKMKERGLLSWKVLYFEKEAGEFHHPSEYTYQSVATLNTHDLPTLRGFLSKKDIYHREKLQLLSDTDSVRQERESEIAALHRLMGISEDGTSDDVAGIVHQCHDLILSSGSQVALLSLHDLLMEEEQPNLPGTVDEYPNWSLYYGTSIPFESEPQSELSPG